MASRKLRVRETHDLHTFTRTTITPAVRDDCTDDERKPLTAWQLDARPVLLVQAGTPGSGARDRARAGSDFAIVHRSGFRVSGGLAFDTAAATAVALADAAPDGWWERTAAEISDDDGATRHDIIAVLRQA